MIHKLLTEILDPDYVMIRIERGQRQHGRLPDLALQPHDWFDLTRIFVLPNSKILELCLGYFGVFANHALQGETLDELRDRTNE